MSPEDHRALREQLGAYTLGQLVGAERLATQAHLQTCAECRAEVAALAPVAAALRTVDPDLLDEAQPAAPPLSSAVLREVRSGRRGEIARQGARRSRRAMLWGAAAAAVGVAAAGGIGYGVGAAVASPPTGEPVPVQAAASQIRANAALVAHTWGMEVKLTAIGFEPGSTYRVSVADRTGRMVNAGEFIGTGGTEMRCNLNSSVLRADATSFQVRDPAGNVVLAAAL
ncbi:MAG: zf-HC2 domain-containing protein [Pseudonocardiaceae bacterium]